MKVEGSTYSKSQATNNLHLFGVIGCISVVAIASSGLLEHLATFLALWNKQCGLELGTLRELEQQ
jgi:hypothetical protein